MLLFIQVDSRLAREKKFTSTQKIFISLLGILTKKGTQPTSVSDAFIEDQLGLSKSYVTKLMAHLKEMNIIRTSRSFGRRQIELSPEIVREYIYAPKTKGD